MEPCLICPLYMAYIASATNLAPHRALVIHTERHFYDVAGAKTRADTGYFMVNLNRNSPHVLNTWLPELKEAKGQGASKILFRAVGPDHMVVFISPAIGITLRSWFLAGGELLAGPEWKTYYIFASSGKESDSFEFWLEVEVPRSYYDGG